MKEKLIEFYLDWVNNWLSTVRMAEHYGLTKRECQELIEMGRKYHEENVERSKNRKPWHHNNKLKAVY